MEINEMFIEALKSHMVAFEYYDSKMSIQWVKSNKLKE